MLKLPRIVDSKARLVGIQVSKDEERFNNNLF